MYYNGLTSGSRVYYTSINDASYGTLTTTIGITYNITMSNGQYAERLCTAGNAINIETSIGTISVPKASVRGITFGSDATLLNIANNFLLNCDNLIDPLVLPSTVKSIGNGFMEHCIKYNSPIVLPVGLTSIGYSFMKNCELFDSTITLPSSLLTIGESFLQGCSKFNQELSLPSGLTVINKFFLHSCALFNKPLSLPNSIKSIDSSFLIACSAFNSDLTLSSNLETIGADFMFSCAAFNKTLTLPNTLTYISTRFMGSCILFNKTLSLPPNLVSIEDDFLSGCEVFNSRVSLPAGLAYIGHNFLYNCKNMSNVVDIISLQPAKFYLSDKTLACDNAASYMYKLGVAIVGTHRDAFLQRFQGSAINPFRKLRLGGDCKVTLNNDYVMTTTANNALFAEILCAQDPTMVFPTTLGRSTEQKSDIKSIEFSTGTSDTSLTALGDYFLYNCDNLTEAVSLPDSVRSIGRSFLEGCVLFDNTISLPVSITSIGDYFLYKAFIYNKELTLPTALKTLGVNFLDECRLFNFDLSLPVGLTSVGKHFMHECDDMTSTVDLGTLGVSIFDNTESTFTLSTSLDTSDMYTSGVIIEGDNKDAFLARFPNRTTLPFRNLRIV